MADGCSGSSDKLGKAPGGVEVYGGNMFAAPLLSTLDAVKVVVRGSSGEPVMFVQRMADDTWSLYTRADHDWESGKARYGVS